MDATDDASGGTDDAGRCWFLYALWLAVQVAVAQTTRGRKDGALSPPPLDGTMHEGLGGAKGVVV